MAQYINPKMQRDALEQVREYMSAHEGDKTPVRDLAMTMPKSDWLRYARAGKSLGMITISRGHVYERGIMWQDEDGRAVEL